jgi:hypothetical protein
MKVSTEIDNNFGYEKITQLVDNIPLSKMRQMSKIQRVHQITVSSILLCSTHYCVQLFTLSRKILCQHLFLIYICSAFPCWNGPSPLLYYGMMWKQSWLECSLYGSVESLCGIQDGQKCLKRSFLEKYKLAWTQTLH